MPFHLHLTKTFITLAENILTFKQQNYGIQD